MENQEKTFGSPYLGAENYQRFHTRAACVFGLEEAIVVEVIHSWCASHRTSALQDEVENPVHFVDGRWWMWDNLVSLNKRMAYMSRSSIRRHIENLTLAGVLIKMESRKGMRQGANWYTIDYDTFTSMVKDGKPINYADFKKSQMSKMNTSQMSKMSISPDAQNEQHTIDTNTTIDSKNFPSSPSGEAGDGPAAEESIAGGGELDATVQQDENDTPHTPLTVEEKTYSDWLTDKGFVATSKHPIAKKVGKYSPYEMAIIRGLGHQYLVGKDDKYCYDWVMMSDTVVVTDSYEKIQRTFARDKFKVIYRALGVLWIDLVKDGAADIPFLPADVTNTIFAKYSEMKTPITMRKELASNVPSKIRAAMLGGIKVRKPPISVGVTTREQFIANNASLDELLKDIPHSISDEEHTAREHEIRTVKHPARQRLMGWRYDWNSSSTETRKSMKSAEQIVAEIFKVAPSDKFYAEALAEATFKFNLLQR